MKLRDFYNDEASEQWFTSRSRRGGVHDNLRLPGISILVRDALTVRYPDLIAPIAQVRLMFIFDAEFEIAYLSFAQGHAPGGFDEFAQEFNARFAVEFVRDAKFRTGADAARAEEYYRMALLPAV